MAIILLTGIGALAVVNDINKGKSPAEQSSFTREFIDEKSKTEDGFYTFTSKSGKYTLLFPKDYQLEKDGSGYEMNKEHFELWSANSVNPSNKDYSNYLQATFSNKGKVLENQHKFSLENFAYKGQINKEELPDKIIYTVASNRNFEKKDSESKYPNIYGPNKIGVFVQDKKSNKTIEVNYSIYCYKKEENECSYSYKQEMHFIKKIAESIHFFRK